MKNLFNKHKDMNFLRMLAYKRIELVTAIAIVVSLIAIATTMNTALRIECKQICDTMINQSHTQQSVKQSR